MNAPADALIRFHLTDGALEDTPPILCGMEARAHMACNGDDDIVLRTEAHTDIDATMQEIEVLQSLGLGTPAENVWILRGDGRIVDLTGAAVQHSDLRGREVQPFTSVSHNDLLPELAERFGFKIKGSSEEEARRANDKGLFMDHSNHPDTNIPRGWSLHRDKVAEKLAGMAKLAPLQMFWVKPQFGASGIGHQSRLRNPKDLNELYPGYDQWVLQEMVPKSFDASVQFAVVGGELYGELEVLGQHIDKHGHHCGNYSLNGNVPGWVIQEARHRVEYLIRTHYAHLQYGVGSVDLIVWLGGYGVARQVYLIELNWRWTAPRYVMQAIKRLRPTLGWNEVHWDMKSFWVPDGLPLGTICGDLTDSLHGGVKFIPFCFMPKHNFCYGLLLAPRPELLAMNVAFLRGAQAELAA